MRWKGLVGLESYRLWKWRLGSSPNICMTINLKWRNNLNLNERNKYLNQSNGDTANLGQLHFFFFLRRMFKLRPDGISARVWKKKRVCSWLGATVWHMRKRRQLWKWQSWVATRLGICQLCTSHVKEKGRDSCNSRYPVCMYQGRAPTIWTNVVFQYRKTRQAASTVAD